MQTMITKQLSDGLIEDKFKKVTDEYNSYFSKINSNSDLANNVVNFIFEMSSKINKVYKSDELKKTGQFHTNNIKIVELMLEHVIDFNNYKSLIGKRLLEPSVGVGLFVIGLIHKLYKQDVKLNDLKEIIENVYMLDISSEMLYFTELNIKNCIRALYKIELEELDKWSLKLIQTDATFKNNGQDLLSDNLFGNVTEFVESEEGTNFKKQLKNDDSKFDLIIGNPPYITLYGRRDMKKTEELRNYYIDNYDFVPKTVKNGKFNITMFFFEQSLHWLKENGELIFIVDISIFETAFADLRKYLLINSKIINIIRDFSSFENVGSGQVIIQLKKINSTEKALNNLVKVTDLETNKKYEIPQLNWYNEDEYKFSVIDDKAIEIIKKIEKQSKELASKYPKKSLRTCTMMLDMEEQFTTFDKSNVSDDLPVMPYYVGSKSLKNKFSSLNFEKYFIYNKSLQDEINDKLKLELEAKGIKNKKRIGLGDLEVYKSPKLFIRQSAKEIIATYTDELSAANNSLYCLSLSNSTIETINDLKVTCSQLNSKLSTFYALSTRIIRTAKGKQPQIKVGDLKKIRVTYSSKVYDKLLKITNAIYTESVKIEEALKEIDEILYSYYGLSSLEINYIEEYIKSF
ncbi:Eco57I restriction-modification methylase domain-containing protein [Lysinibacillus sp. A4]|uniref:Eco57I restriction-modification methylase domain-containing protein n=1 Tax=Lysinibacillus sp. A4 TaxID=2976269 RepID=UPI00217598AA|nr:TaqI-like C-terminal specificity domain-containing protein [Lysinibacillus sp. A4]MCS5502751.1 Eco57I restriction-modification methylase domain-containing protein [Lysinibacillus sp. A4]